MNLHINVIKFHLERLYSELTQQKDYQKMLIIEKILKLLEEDQT